MEQKQQQGYFKKVAELSNWRWKSGKQRIYLPALSEPEPDKDCLPGRGGATHDPMYADLVGASPDEEPNKMNPAQFKRVASQ